MILNYIIIFSANKITILIIYLQAVQGSSREAYTRTDSTLARLTELTKAAVRSIKHTGISAELVDSPSVST